MGVLTYRQWRVLLASQNDIVEHKDNLNNEGIKTIKTVRAVKKNGRGHEFFKDLEMHVSGGAILCLLLYRIHAIQPVVSEHR